MRARARLCLYLITISLLLAQVVPFVYQLNKVSDVGFPPVLILPFVPVAMGILVNVMNINKGNEE